MPWPSSRPLLIGYLWLFCAGCGSTVEPVWREDSKSFYFTAPEHVVTEYSLTQDATRSVITTESDVGRVALSPNGAWMVVANAACGPESRAVAVHLVRAPDGRLLDSQMMTWGKHQGARSPVPAAAWWSPKGDHVLIGYLDVQRGSLRTALYDVQQKTLAEVLTTSPAYFLSYWGVSPIVGDGSGYLAVDVSGELPRFEYVNWEGWQYELKCDDSATEDFQRLGDSKGHDVEKLKLVFPLAHGSWNGRKLTIQGASKAILFDLDERKIRELPMNEAVRDRQKLLTTFPVQEGFVCQTEPIGDGTLVIAALLVQGQQGLRVELWDRKQAGRRLLFEGMKLPDSLGRILIPAPDRQHLVVQMQQQGKSVLHLLGADGTRIKTLSTSSGGTQPGGNQ